MIKHRTNTSRLTRIEDRKNRNQAVLFVLLTVGFLILLLFVVFPLFVDLIGKLGDMRSSNTPNEKNDVIAPVAPTIILSLEATNSANLAIKGYSEPSSKVYLVVNANKQSDKITGEDGSFSFDSVPLDEGNNQIYAYAQDLAGNKSTESKTLDIIYDSQKPKLEISSPQKDQKFYYEDQEIIVAGKTDIDSNIKVNDYIATVDTEGNFVKKILLHEGKNDIKIEALDIAGNKVEESLSVEYFK